MNHPSPDQIRATLDQVLPVIQKPTRYLGSNAMSFARTGRRSRSGSLWPFRMPTRSACPIRGPGFCTTSSTGATMRLAERTFAPMPDMAEEMRGEGLPLFTLESYRAVADFDVVGISLQSELNYINVPYLLDLAGIARRRRHAR